MPPSGHLLAEYSPAYTASRDVRQALRSGHEIALLDVREEDEFAKAHPLFAANLPLSRLELDAQARLPRHDAPLVVYDNGEGLAAIAARRLVALGYSRVSLLDDGLSGWRDSGGELFQDVNVPSKAFGELVEARCHTPSLSAEELRQRIDANSNLVIVDARRFDEYQTMSIPGSISLPGGELVLRIADVAPDPKTLVVVNCAGRTRSIIGAQSLINAGIPNPVAALRNGTIGWTLAGDLLEHQQSRRVTQFSAEAQQRAQRAAHTLAERAGVLAIDAPSLARWQRADARSHYLFDVRTPEEYAERHLPGFLSAPGGQLVQETDHFAPIRGARIILFDDDGVRANMTGSWLAQMGWETYVLEGGSALLAATLPAPVSPSRVEAPPSAAVEPATLAAWLASAEPPTVLDFASSARYVRQHIPSAWFVLRSQLAQALSAIPPARRYVLSSEDGELARFAAAELAELVDAEIFVLEGGTQRWTDANLPLVAGSTRLASPTIDRYRRPYEGTDNPREAIQGYLDWEFGLIEQIERDATHRFQVLTPNQNA